PLSFLLYTLPPSSTLFPYTTLFRSVEDGVVARVADDGDLGSRHRGHEPTKELGRPHTSRQRRHRHGVSVASCVARRAGAGIGEADRKSTRLNSSRQIISYAVFCLKK